MVLRTWHPFPKRLSSRKFYVAPCRLAVCSFTPKYGVPGSGKTSLIHSLAGELGLDVYMISLSRAGLDDSTLQELISFLPEKCIALMEDIDAAFRHDINRELPSTDHAHAASPGVTTGNQSRGVTLSGLLNAIDGVAAHEGRLLFATTNHFESLDPALRRPGRMDRHIEFKLASRNQVEEMFQRFYTPTTSGSLPPFSEKPIHLHDDEGEQSSVGNRRSRTPDSAVTLVDIDSDSPISRTVSLESSNHGPVAAKGDQMAWQAAALGDQARKFASLVPERFISMAELQGYLMLHRNGPVSAISSVGRFIMDKESRERLIRARATLKVE